MTYKKINSNSKNTPQAVKEQHEKSVEYKLSLGEKGLFEQTKKNERFFVGDQWMGNSTKSNLPLVEYNFCRRIGEYKEAQILSNPLTANFTADGVASFRTDEQMINDENIINSLKTGDEGQFNALSDDEKTVLIMSALTDYFETTSERLKFSDQSAKVLHNAYVSGTGAMYVFWDESIRTGQFVGDGNTEITGDISAEVLNAEEQLDFDNPSEKDINKQDYIIISKKVTVAEAKRIAAMNGIKPEEIEKITKDNDSNFSAERDEKANDSVDRVTVFTKLFKSWSDDNKQFKIYCYQCTQTVTIREAFDTGLQMYPIALFCWEDRAKSIFGDTELTYLIPNQIAVNRMITASVWSAMINGMPTLLINRNYIKGEVSNNPGQIWEFYGDDNSMDRAARYLNPPPINSALTANVNDIVNNTLQMSGANDAALGNLRADNATAIAQAHEAATAPMQMIKNRFYQFYEDLARICAEFWFKLYGERKLKISDKQGSWFLPFDSENYKNLSLTVKIDVGASTMWSQTQSQARLDNLLAGNYINFLQYLERQPKGSINDITGLIRDFKEQQAAEQRAQEEQNAVDNFTADDFYDSLSPQEKEQFDSLDLRTQQQMIEQAKNDVKGVNGNEDEL